MVLSLSSSLFGNDKAWQIAEPQNEDHLDVTAMAGPIIGRSIQGNSFHYPTGGQRDEAGKLWISNYYAQIHQVNEDFAIDFTPDITYQAPASGDGVAYLQDMSLSLDGSKLILAVSYGHHCVKVYDRDTGDLISTIGVPNGRGNVDQNRLWNPHSAVKLSGDRVAVTSYNGFAPGANNHGSVTVWDISTPTATLDEAGMGFYDGGISAVGTNKIHRPMRMIQDKDNPDHVWISEYTRGKVLKVDTTTWQTIDIINSPPDTTTINNSYGLAQMSDGTIVVASNAARKIYGINPDTKLREWEIRPENYGLADNSMRGVFELSPGWVAWASWGDQLIAVTKVGQTEIPYSQIEVPEGWAIAGTYPEGILDLNSFSSSAYPHEIASKSSPIAILLEKN